MRIVVSLGGSALIHRGEHADARAQQRRIAEFGPALRRLSAEHELIVVFGSGVNVGLFAAESETDPELSAGYPLDALEAESQGLVGYWLANELDAGRPGRPAAALITRVVVDPQTLTHAPTDKFLGPIFSREEAQTLSRLHGWEFAPDRAWWRRVVASPAPVEIVELAAIGDLLHAGWTVICGGGGGVPVIRDEAGMLHGVAAAVDKDAVAAVIARGLGADALLLLTDVDAVYRDYTGDEATALRELDAADLRAMEFPPGSMGAKARAAADFAESTGRPAFIGAAHRMIEVLAGHSGTAVRSANPEAERRMAAESAAWTFN